ncbi:MAG: hypothetical protein ACFCU3_01895 [Verrucomicrobiales bacterium]
MVSRLLKLWQNNPFKWLVILIVLCVVIRENFPFSHYPMYSRFPPRAEFMVVQDQDEVPVGFRTQLRTTSPRVGKMYESRLRAGAAENNMSTAHLTDAQRFRVGSELLAFLCEQLSAKRQERLPEEMSLILYEVTLKDRSMHREATRIGYWQKPNLNSDGKE